MLEDAGRKGGREGGRERGREGGRGGRSDIPSALGPPTRRISNEYADASCGIEMVLCTFQSAEGGQEDISDAV